MNQQSLLFSSQHDLQKTRDMKSSPLHNVHSYHAMPSPEWWSLEKSSFMRSNVGRQITPISATRCYSSSSISSPYPESPSQNSNFAALSYSSSSITEVQSRFEAEFGFLAQNIEPSLGKKQWAMHADSPSLPTSEWPVSPIDAFDSNSWDEMILSALNDDAAVAHSPASSHYTTPSPPSFRYLLPCPSPPPSQPSSGWETPASSAASSSNRTGKTCSHCAATYTPLWRRDPVTHHPLCNACGLYLQQHNKMRPAVLIAADQRDEDPDPDAEVALGAPECSHCHTHHTSVWRRSKTGAKLCNACGVYARLRGRDRPLSLKRNKIRPRCKHPKRIQS
ncbi:hypothetical protein MVEN_01284800 [Mycena venus]|uniref:GATA-type domain-containing protein n=1 Tax=Mycena venus TaxID=2733690 RepID=A0A8H7CWG0_9AGAR|nr:hypothetical protein MVEN_01284800 [Mycena venus]